jgi:hypothetical protein
MKLKKLILIFVFISGFAGLFSQSVVVTDIAGYTTGEASSMLDIKSTTKGLLIPRVILTSSLSSALPVSAPATGLLVYNEGANQPLGFYYWNGSAWTTMGVASSADGSETKINAGSTVSVAGNGTTDTPYVINFAPQSVTLAQRSSISPVTSLLIWCSNCGPSGEIQVYNGSTWTSITGGSSSPAWPPSIGDSYQGGKIAYMFQPGDPGYIAGQTHGLITAASDISTNAIWGCNSQLLSGGDGMVLGTGNQNTIDIVAGCATGGIAARLCSDLDLNGYSDWYLPSRDELYKLFTNKTAIGGFTSNYYSSSSEYNAGSAYCVIFDVGTITPGSKGVGYYVRPVRSF